MNYQIPNRANFGVKYEELRVKRIIDLLYPRMIFFDHFKNLFADEQQFQNDNVEAELTDET